MVVEEQPEPQHPGRAQPGMMRQHEAQRPGQVRRDAGSAPRARSAPRAPAGTHRTRDSAGRRGSAWSTSRRCRRRDRSARPAARVRPRPAASRAMPAPLMPPPMMARSKSAMLRCYVPGPDAPDMTRRNRSVKLRVAPQRRYERELTDGARQCLPPPARRRRQHRRTARQAGDRRRRDHERRLCGPAAPAAARAPWSTSAIRPIPAPTCRSAGLRAMTGSRSPARRSTSMTAGRQIDAADRARARSAQEPGRRCSEAAGACRSSPSRRAAWCGRTRRAARSASAARIALTPAGPRASDVSPARPPCSTPSRCISTRSRRCAPGTTVLAANAHSDVQAAEIKVDGAVAWGVQYHPEFSLADMAAIVRRYRRAADATKASSPTRRRATRYVGGPRGARPRARRQAARLALRHRRDGARLSACARPRSPTGSRIRCCRRVARRGRG